MTCQVLFVNLGIKESDLVAISSQHDLSIVQNVLEAVQLAVYKYEVRRAQDGTACRVCWHGSASWS